MTQPVPSITPAPATPTPGTPAFRADAFAWSQWVNAHHVPEMQALAENAKANADLAETEAAQAASASGSAQQAAAQAAQSAASASASTGATAWNPTTAYAVGNVVFISGAGGGLTYRRQVAGTTATSPDADATNWRLVVSPAIVPVYTSTTADAGTPFAAPGTYRVRASGAVITFENSNSEWTGLFTLQRAAGQTLNGKAEDLVFGPGNEARRVEARYVAANNNWLISAQ